MTKEYVKWFGMFERCYTSSDIHCPSYVGCTVHQDWHNFQVFAEWCNKQSGFKQEGWHLDKDILVKGNREYGPNTCCFVPGEINCLMLNKRKFIKYDLPQGVSLDSNSNKYIAQFSPPNKTTPYLGRFNTIKEAFNVYKKYKECYIKTIAEKWKNMIDTKVYESLINWEISLDV